MSKIQSILLRQWLIVIILSLRGERKERQSNLPKASVLRRSLRRSTPRDDRSIELSSIRLIYAGLTIFTLVLMNPGFGQDAYGGLEAWYHANTLAMVGAGSALSNTASDQMNPAAMESETRQFTLGFLAYPAGVRSGQIGFMLPGKKGITMFSVRNVNYGVFDGYDEQGNATGTYTASDTWLSAAYRQSFFIPEIKIGFTVGYFTSQIEAYKSTVLMLTPGIVYTYDPLDVRLGISLQNMGRVLKGYTRQKESLPETIVAGIAKKLKHLPMNLCADFGLINNTGETWVRIGGVVQLSPFLEARWGTSTQKLNQSTQVRLSNDFFGSTGVGLTIHVEGVDIDFGSYMFGTGGWIHGFGCEVQF